MDGPTDKPNLLQSPESVNMVFLSDALANIITVAKETRPDTRPIPVVDGWAGAEMHVFALSQLDHHVPTDQPTEQPTDGRTKPLIESLVRD